MLEPALRFPVMNLQGGYLSDHGQTQALTVSRW